MDCFVFYYQIKKSLGCLISSEQKGEKEKTGRRNRNFRNHRNLVLISLLNELLGHHPLLLSIPSLCTITISCILTMSKESVFKRLGKGISRIGDFFAVLGPSQLKSLRAVSNLGTYIY